MARAKRVQNAEQGPMQLTKSMKYVFTVIIYRLGKNILVVPENPTLFRRVCYPYMLR